MNSIQFGIVVIIVLLVVEAFKRMNVFPKNLIPVLSIVIGATIGAVLGGLIFDDYSIYAFVGIVAGGFSSGIYDAVSANFDKVKEVLHELTKGEDE